jgi:type I restriction enzyme R subunit
MDSYRVEKQAAMKIALADEDAEIEPVPTERRRPQARAGARPAVEHPQGLQRPVRQHPVEDADRVRKLITEEIPPRRAGQGLPERAQELRQAERRIEHDKALGG